MTLLDTGDAQAGLDLTGNGILWASKNAWRHLAWAYEDPQTGESRLLPAEHFGPLPQGELSFEDRITAIE